MANVFDFRPGRSLKNVNPQEVGEELERLQKENGSLTPAIVLEAAADPESPLHNGFEWDDTAAANHHRLNQARRLIVSIRVLNSPTARATVDFVSVKTPDKGREYVPITEALSTEELRARVMAEARQAIEALERRYAHFEGIADMLASLKKNVG